MTTNKETIKTAPISFRIAPDLKRKLEDMAAKESRSLSSMIEIILKAQVMRNKKDKP